MKLHELILLFISWVFFFGTIQFNTPLLPIVLTLNAFLNFAMSGIVNV